MFKDEKDRRVKGEKMGWSNYIIVEDWKMIIETDRGVDGLEYYIKESLDKMISDDTDIVDISCLKVNDITIKDLCVMTSAYENANSLAFMETDKLFLYWLESKEIKYEIKQEHGLDLKKYKEDGYKIIRRWKSDNDNDNGGNQEISKEE
jgi:hypothetical protein